MSAVNLDSGAFQLERAVIENESGTIQFEETTDASTANSGGRDGKSSASGNTPSRNSLTPASTASAAR